ncbi:MAG: hypothetical protein JWL66_174 [Sphingomonadales bacterium]|nr:hypothetical protein [Sphingomonadales bacterium]
MSRIADALASIFIAVAAFPSTMAHADALATYRAFTTVEPHCAKPANGNEIVVCGNRRADRWRVPFVGYDAGDPNGEGVSHERNRLASEPPLHCGIGAVLKNCGMVGVSVGAKFASGKLQVRQLAP